MVTLTQLVREFDLPQRIRRFVNGGAFGVIATWLFSFLFDFFIFFFLFLTSWLLDFELSLGKVEEEGEEIGEEGEDSTS